MQDLATPEPLKVFISYSHKDERHLNNLRGWLRGLEREGLIEWWHDREISPGWEWEEAIDQNLRAADVILFLVSPDFMASDYVYEKEIGQAVERHKQGEARVIPIIVRPTVWKLAPFGKLQALPKDAKPVTTWSNRDQAWLDVVEQIRKAVEELSPERQKLAAKERYRKAVGEVWADNNVSSAEAERLTALASELGLSTDTAADIERDIMDDIVQAILQRQAREREEEERQRHLENLYAQARGWHQDQEWQAVVNVFKQIRAEDPDYPDPENLLTSARKTLDELAQKEDAVRQYREGVEAAWTDRKLDKHEVKTLRDLADKVEVGPSDCEKIEREVMGDTKEATLERQERAAKKRERKLKGGGWRNGKHERYRKALEPYGQEGKLSHVDVEQLASLKHELGLSPTAAGNIEREVLGSTVEDMLSLDKPDDLPLDDRPQDLPPDDRPQDLPP